MDDDNFENNRIIDVKEGIYRGNSVINVGDFGAKGDGITDDTQAIINAIQSVGSRGATILFTGVHLLGKITPGSSYLGNYFLPITSNVEFVGINNATLKVKDHIFDKLNDATSNAHVFQGEGVENVKFSNMIIDMNGANNLCPQGHIRNGMAIRITGGGNVTIKDCQFLNCAGHNAVALNNATSSINKNAILRGNLFRNGGRYVGGATENPYNDDFSFVYTEWDNSIITGNVIEQENIEIALTNWSGGIEIHASNSEVAYNTIRGCDPALYICSCRADTPIQSSLIINNNNIVDCLRGISFWVESRVNNIHISSNNITLQRSTRRSSAVSAGILIPNGGTSVYDSAHANGAVIKNINIIDNIITCNFPVGDTEKARGMEIHSLDNALIKNNKIYNMTDIGLILMGSPWGNQNITIEGNTISDCGRGNVLGVNPTGNKSGIYLNLSGSSSIPNSPFWTKNLFVQNNDIFNTHTETFNSSGEVVNNFCNGGIYAGICVANFATAILENIWIKENHTWNVPAQIYGGTNPRLLEGQNSQAHFLPRTLTIQGESLQSVKIFQGDVIHYLGDNSVYKCIVEGVVNCSKTGTITGNATNKIVSCNNSNSLRVGWTLEIRGAGPSGATLYAKIVSINGNQLTLETAIVTSVVGANYIVFPSINQKYTNNVVGYGSAPPTSGIYNLGDMYYNTTSNGGSSMAWICTAGGTPGTWLPVGYIGQNKIAPQADSTATDLLTIKNDFNALLGKIRTAGLM